MAKEARRGLIRLVLPLVIASATDVVMRFSDQFFLSRFPQHSGEVLLSAALNGGAFVHTLAVVVIMTLSFVNSLASQYRGMGKTQMCAQVTYQACYLGLFCYPLLLAATPLLPKLMALMGHQPEMGLLASTYATPLLIMGVFTFLRAALSGFFAGVGRPVVSMGANLLAMMANIPLNYLLIFGPGPLPSFGLAGAAWATGAANAISCSLLLVKFWSKDIHKNFHSRNPPPLYPKLIWKLIRYGGPASLGDLVNMLSISVFLLSMGFYGTIVSSAVTIVISWDLLIFIPLTGISQATTALAGRDIGANNYPQVRQRLKPLFLFAYACVLPAALILLLFPQALILPFTKNMAQPAAVIALATGMLRLTSIYVCFDVSSQILIGVLRAAGDTVAIMLIVAGSHLLMAVIAFFAIRFFQLPPLFCWMIFTAMVICISTGIFLRYRSGKWQHIRIIS